MAKRQLIFSLCLLGVLLAVGCGLQKAKEKEVPEETTTTVYNGVETPEEEEVVFSFITPHEKKLVLSYSTAGDRLVYRFFNKNQLELEMPNEGVSSWGFFSFADDHRAKGPNQLGIDVNFLVFENGNFRYEVYDNYNTAGQGRLVGVNVTNLSTGEFTHIEGDSEKVIGSLMLLYERFPKLNHEHVFEKSE